MSATAERELVIRWAPIPHTAQEPAFDDDTPDSTVVFLGGYAAGKTMWLVAKMLKLSVLNAPHLGLWVVPDYGHIFDTIMPTLESRDPLTGDPWFLELGQFHFHQTRHEFTWIGGGPIKFVTAENPDSIAGPNVAFAGCDEPGDFDHRAWRNTVARVRHPSAKCRQKVVAGTPQGLNWFGDLVGADRPANVHVYRMATRENSELLKHHPSYMEEVRANATEAEVQSYLEGKVVNLTGALAYPMFDAATHWRTDIQINPMEPLCVSFDFNVDPMACIVGQIGVGDNGPEPYVVDTLTLFASTVQQVCAEFVQRYPVWAPGLWVYGDQTGKNRSHQSLKSNYDIIQQLLSQVGPVTQKVPTANPPVARRLNSVNRLLKDARGVVRFAIRKTEPGNLCTTKPLVRSLEQTVKKPGTDDIWKKPGETATHHGDALGYWLDYEWPAQRPMVSVATITVADLQGDYPRGMSETMAGIKARKSALLAAQLAKRERVQ